MTRIYLSAAFGDAPAMAKDRAELRVLFSFYYYRDADMDEVVATSFAGLKLDAFADSGAFSAFTLGDTVDEGAYIHWVKRWSHLFTAVAGPDVIGDPEKTHAATVRMRKAVTKIPVLPVFHVGEPVDFLDRWRGVEMIALGGMVPYVKSDDLLAGWISSAWRRMKPSTKVHGFGVTTLRVLRSFPWYSVDSTSWTAPFRYGLLRLFDGKRVVPINMRKGRELLKHARLLASYGIRPTEARADGFERARLVQASVDSWQRIERSLTRRGKTRAA